MKSSLTILSVVFVMGLSVATDAQIAPGEVETPWKGYVMSSFNETAALYLITLSEEESDGMVRVGYLIEWPAGKKPPSLKGVATLEYTGGTQLNVSFRTKERFHFTIEENGGGTQVLAFQRLRFKPKSFMSHAEAASEVFKSFKAFPRTPSRDKKPG
jgi:hypothetical protein